MLTRRRLIQHSGSATAALLLVGPDAVAAPPVAGYLRRSGYTGLIGTRFAVTAPDGSTVPLTLTAVSDLSDPALKGSDAAFALTLTGPPGLPQGTHAFRHPRLGSFDLFAVPVGPVTAPQAYDVTIDHSTALPPGLRLPAGPPLKPLLSHLRVGRRRHAIRLDLRFATAEAAEVLVDCTGRGRRLRATGAVRKRRARVVLHAAAPLPRGVYDVAVTIVRRDRSRVVEHVRVRLR